MAKKYLDLQGLTTYDGNIKEYIGSQIDTKVATAISGVTQFNFEVVEGLPETGVKGTIYLVPATDALQPDSYDEYIYVEREEGDNWELIGNTRVDMDNYYTKTEADGKFAGKSVASQTASGLMSATDKTKLDGLENYTLPKASTSQLGGIKVGTNLSIDNDGVLTADDTSYSFEGGTNKFTYTAQVNGINRGSYEVKITPEIGVYVGEPETPTWREQFNTDVIRFDENFFAHITDKQGKDAITSTMTAITTTEINNLFPGQNK